MDVIITNAMALEVKRVRINMHKGQNSVTIPISDLQAGNYYIRLSDSLVLENLIIAR
jgi:hypothetical protein